MILHEIDNSDDVWMRLLSEYRKLILEQLNINLLLLNGLLLHDFNCKSLTTAFVHAETDNSKSSLTECFSENITIFDISHLLELFVIIYMKSLLFCDAKIAINISGWSSISTKSVAWGERIVATGRIIASIIFRNIHFRHGVFGISLLVGIIALIGATMSHIVNRSLTILPLISWVWPSTEWLHFIIFWSAPLTSIIFWNQRILLKIVRACFELVSFFWPLLAQLSWILVIKIFIILGISLLLIWLLLRPLLLLISVKTVLKFLRILWRFWCIILLLWTTCSVSSS